MKTSLRIMGVLVILAMLVGLLPGAATPTAAVAGTLQFGTVSFRTATALLQPNTEVSFFDISPNGSNILFVDTPNGTVKRSSSGGTSQVTIQAYLVAAGAAAPFHYVAASPDDDNFWAIVTNNRTRVYISTDNGATWNNTNVPALGAQIITGVAVSGQYQTSGGNARDIVICTADATPLALGTVQVLQLKPLGVGGWINQAAPAAAYHALALAPAYAGDFSVVAVGSTAGGTFLNLGFRDVNLNATTWNSSANYPVNITNDVLVRPSPTFLQIVSADLALPADFSGQVDRMRRAYVCYDTGVAALASAGVYRVDNYRPYSLQSPELRPYAISYSGSFNAGKLLMTAVSAASAPGVGASPSVPVWRTLNAQTSFPTWDLPYKAPTGALGIGVIEARAFAKWKKDGKSAILGSSSNAAAMNTAALYLAAFPAGVAYDESAVSRTEDDSDSWDQVSLIDTASTLAGVGTAGLGIYDVAPSADNTTMYLASINTVTNIAGIWRSKSSSGALGFSSWVRVGTFNVLGAPNPIIRLAPDKADGSVVFWGASSGVTSIVQRSVDSGKFWQNTLPGFVFADFSAADQNTLFLLSAGGTLRKGTSAGAGFTWGSTIDARILGGNTIEAKGNNIVVGNTAAGGTFVAYSLDGATFTRIMYATPVGGLRYAAMDADFANNKTLYVTSGGVGSQIYRWIIGTNTNEWTTFTQSPASAAGHSSIAVGPDKGTVYAVKQGIPAALPITGPGIDRTINGTSGDPKPGVEFDHLWVGATTANFNLPAVNAVVPAMIAGAGNRLKVAGKAPNVALYHPDNNTGPDLYAFIDTLTGTAPAITSPKTNSILPVAFNGFAVPFGIHWTTTVTGTSQAAGPQDYDVQVALMDDFSDIILVTPANGVVVGTAYKPPNVSDPSVTIGANALMGGQSYYIRVRVRSADSGQAIRSAWGPTVKADVQAGNPIQAPSGGPQSLAPQTTGAGTLPGFSWTAQSGSTTEYTFVLSEKADLSSPVVNTTTATTSFQVTTALKAGTTYFWQVQATKPVPGPKSSVFSFTTSSPAPPPVTVAPQPTPVVTVVVPPTPVQGTPGWVWVVIGIGALLVIVTIVLIFRTRRV